MKNKKFMSRVFSAVLAGAMVLSMSAFAAFTDANGTTYESIDGTHHKVTLSNGDSWETSCNFVFDESADTCICGNDKTCDHTGNHWEYDNKGETHDVVCADCKEVVTPGMEHDYTHNNGKCICGAEEPACDHMGNHWEYDNKGETHDVVCGDCKEVVTPGMEHDYTHDNGKCICGAEEPACDHMGNHWEYDNKGETHDVVCADCKEVVTAGVEHYYIDGKCICGAVEAKCDHMKNNWEYVDNKNGSHKVICKDCETVVTEEAACALEGTCVCGHYQAPTVVDGADADIDLPMTSVPSRNFIQVLFDFLFGWMRRI